MSFEKYVQHNNVTITFKGPVRFYNNERRANILLKQFQKRSEIKVGEYNAVHQKLDFDAGEPFRWVSCSFKCTDRQLFIDDSK